jgi:hypothetical protein
MDDVAVWDVMVDAANNGCVLTSEGVRLAILAADAELKRLRIDLSKPPQEREYCAGCSLPDENKQLREEYEKVYDLLMACRSDLMKVTGITQEDAQAELRRRAKEG